MFIISSCHFSSYGTQNCMILFITCRVFNVNSMKQALYFQLIIKRTITVTVVTNYTVAFWNTEQLLLQ